MRHIIWEEYNDMFEYNELLLAHIWQECPVLTYDCGYGEGSARNDYGYGIGLAQWNIHIRTPFVGWFNDNYYYRPSNPAYTTEVREAFFKEFPYMATWDGQFRFYMVEMQGCYNKFKSMDTCIHRWNSLSPGYLASVKNNIYKIRELL